MSVTPEEKKASQSHPSQRKFSYTAAVEDNQKYQEDKRDHPSRQKIAHRSASKS